MQTSRPSADDLLVLLEVARSGRFSRAAETLGVNQVTVSRRIAALEHAVGGKLLVRSASGWELTDLGRRALAAAEQVDGVLQKLESGSEVGTEIEDVVRLSAPDGFTTFVAAPAAAHLHQNHPGISVEIVSATRRAAQHRSGLDIEIVVGEPRVMRARALRLGGYVLGLYATPDYLARNGSPAGADDLARHRLIYFISSMLQVDDLDVGRRHLPEMRDAVTSTNVFAHIEATRAGGGIGLLPTFMITPDRGLVRLLPDEVSVEMSYWLVAREDTLRRPAVAAMVRQLMHTMQGMGTVLSPTADPVV
ncbi:LysR family transcriptional regulator [Streptomyces caeruleatus]|uniref:LysR family transcriptional regulator n=1 Tax=Streptomyces caeruleatus TaxID=661399 RepID=A0A101U7A7_9ACTN|nr:LysR family transcriptional regulator [Streptomyces caeruleatus]KUO05548.1 LysR family transcriptional regulator [Streptomyces caeruleatus]